ncbi:MAG TPA: hypothetical protein VEP90_06295 [Methylomirabilota bacterium]|nr:hypothetical protein [Methylomirabilota bacterium]
MNYFITIYTDGKPTIYRTKNMNKAMSKVYVCVKEGLKVEIKPNNCTCSSCDPEW